MLCSLLSAHSFLILSALCSMFVVHEIDETNGTDETDAISCFRTYVPSGILGNVDKT